MASKTTNLQLTKPNGVDKFDVTTFNDNFDAIDTAVGNLNKKTETDPVYSASPAASITADKITSWDNKSNFSGAYNDLSGKPTIPQFIEAKNEADALTKSQADPNNIYYVVES